MWASRGSDGEGNTHEHKEGGIAGAFYNGGSEDKGSAKRSRCWIYDIAVVCLVILLLAALASWIWFRRYRKPRWRLAKSNVKRSLALELINTSTTSIMFTFNEIKKTTGNFSRNNIIIRFGGYDNVNKGVLTDGT
ncbi:hypothetical protein Cni_G26199 [Canna indica]|uniref:Uncharacterized protein n=1 Tax=Canna indica TaxID=4628 RepID=A0AAQ3L1K4_9LILI|nr:hypothetical protein Cni_G26199 [Canna indica]